MYDEHGIKTFYSCEDIPRIKAVYRKKNGTDEIIAKGGRDRMYERFCENLDKSCCCKIASRCEKCSENDHEGPDKMFCRCEGRNIKLAKQLRNEGKSPWQKNEIIEKQD